MHSAIVEASRESFNKKSAATAEEENAKKIDLQTFGCCLNGVHFEVMNLKAL